MSLNLDLFQDDDFHSEILGLDYQKDFLSSEEEKSILKFIDSQEWSNELKRRVQHYGYKYNYKVRKIDKTLKTKEIPKYLDFVLTRLIETHIFDEKPDQLIVNEYQVGQGISRHIDCEPCFRDVIVMISLNSSCVMKFTKPGEDAVEVYLEPRSILICKDEARYDWSHEIPARKTDKHLGQTIRRSRRVSLTFRQVIQS